MKKKSNLVLFLILIFLVLIFFIPKLKNFIISKGSKDVENIKFFPNLQTSSINKIEIKSPSHKVVLVKKQGKWIVEDYDYEANRDYIDEVFSSINALTTQNLISSNPNKFNIFEVDEKSGIKVIVHDQNNKKYGFIIGKIGSDYNSIFCRKSGDNNVYLIEKNIKLSFEKGGAEGWLNRTILKFTEEKLKEIRYKYDGEETLLAKDVTGKWKYPADEKVSLNEDAIKNIISSLSSLTFANLEKGISEEEAGVSVPKKMCTLLFSDGKKVTLILGTQKDDNLFYCKVDNKKEIFSIYKWTADSIFKTLSEMTAK